MGSRWASTTRQLIAGNTFEMFGTSCCWRAVWVLRVIATQFLCFVAALRAPAVYLADVQHILCKCFGLRDHKERAGGIAAAMIIGLRLVGGLESCRVNHALEHGRWSFSGFIG